MALLYMFRATISPIIRSKAIAENKNAIVASCWTYFTTKKLGVPLPLLTCSPSAWPSRLLYRRGRKSRRDLRSTRYYLNSWRHTRQIRNLYIRGHSSPKFDGYLLLFPAVVYLWHVTLATDDVFQILYRQKHHCFFMIPEFNVILQFVTVFKTARHLIWYYFFMIRFNIIIPSTSRSSKETLSFNFPRHQF